MDRHDFTCFGCRRSGFKENLPCGALARSLTWRQAIGQSTTSSLNVNGRMEVRGDHQSRLYYDRTCEATAALKHEGHKQPIESSMISSGGSFAHQQSRVLHGNTCRHMGHSFIRMNGSSWIITLGSVANWYSVIAFVNTSPMPIVSANGRNF